MKTLLVITLAICGIASSTFDIDESAELTDCSEDTEWIEGSGEIIQVLLRSTFKSVYKKYKIKSIFASDKSELIAVSDEVDGREVSWVKHGEKRLDGWIYGNFIDKNHVTGDKVYYIYADMHTALRARFKYGFMTHGREVKITHFRCLNDFLLLNFSQPKPDAPWLKYEHTTETFLTSEPTIMDPIDRRNVYVGPSTLGVYAGEGLFAKRQLRSGDLICILAGAKVPLNDYEPLTNNTSELDQETTAVKVTLGHDLIDVPHYDVVKYRASLGHKANHNFNANAKYCAVNSPRFGEQRCLEAITTIRKGSEIFIDYLLGNPKHFPDRPSWYIKYYRDAIGDGEYVPKY